MTAPKITLQPHATALTIAGSDPSGGAGIQVDLKAFQQTGTYGMAVITLLTVQNTVGISRVEVLKPALISEQIDAVLSDIPPRAIKTGALGNAENIVAVAERLKHRSADLVVDPVLVSKHGDRLADDTAVDACRDHLLPLATLITPNRYEAERLLGRSLRGADRDALVQAGFELAELGPQFVLLKAGTLEGRRCHVFVSSEEASALEVEELDTQQTHGAGCALSATITARLALTSRAARSQGKAAQVGAAIDFAIQAVHHAIKLAPKLGGGCGPVESRLLHWGE